MLVYFITFFFCCFKFPIFTILYLFHNISIVLGVYSLDMSGKTGRVGGFFFSGKVRDKSGNSVKTSGKMEISVYVISIILKINKYGIVLF